MSVILVALARRTKLSETRRVILLTRSDCVDIRNVTQNRELINDAYIRQSSFCILNTEKKAIRTGVFCLSKSMSVVESPLFQFGSGETTRLDKIDCF